MPRPVAGARGRAAAQRLPPARLAPALAALRWRRYLVSIRPLFFYLLGTR